jgi:hypothetical protein
MLLTAGLSTHSRQPSSAVKREEACSAPVPSLEGTPASEGTATIVHQLAQEGKLDLSDTLEKWLPGMSPTANR